MRLLLFVMLTLLFLAELVARFWFTGNGGDFFDLTARAGLRSDSLRGEAINELLIFDEGSNYLSDRGGDVTLTLLTWRDGNSHGLMDAFGHSPEVCLPISGATLLAEFPVREIQMGSETLEVESWMFSHPLIPKKLHAFKFARSSHRALLSLGHEKKMSEARFLLLRERSLMPTIEIGIGLVQGTSQPDLAWERFSRFLRENFKLQAPP